MLKRKRLGDILIAAGLLTPEQLNKALSIQKKTGERLGKVLTGLGYITEEKIIEALEMQLGVKHVNLSELNIAREIAGIIPVALAERYQIVPIKLENKKITLAMVDPTNFFAIDDVRMMTSCEVEPVIALEKDILQAIDQLYGVNEVVEKAVKKLKPDDFQRESQIQTAEDAPIISIVNSILNQAVKERASDIHIEPLETAVRVRFRVDGVLREVVTFPKHTQAAIVSRIKIMCDMDIAEKRLPQDGRINIKEAGREIDVRVSTLPTINGEKVVMRILDKQAVILNIKALGLSAENLDKYKKLYSQAYGMILVTGPTGSGKSTTLYSTLAVINSPEKNIITIEDPVEYRIEGINQMQVNPKTGLTFAGGLRSILRQDPNIVMVGEIRDSETADIAIRAALTGHLVFSTLHTNDAAGAITRLTDMGVEPFLVSSSVLGVVAQRLVRLICPECKQRYEVVKGSKEWEFMGLTDNDETVILSRGNGCPRCNYTGYHGRMAIHEVLLISPTIRAAITKRVSSDELAKIAKNEGMTTMKEDGIIKALQGITTIEEIMRVAYSSFSR